MDIYAEEAGLAKRWIIPVPFLTPRLSSYWIHLVTPVPSTIARPLAEGLSNPVVCQENRIRSIIPQELISCPRAIRLALGRVREECVETCWTDAGTLDAPEWVHCGDASYSGGNIMESGYRMVLDATAEEVWKPIVRIGGYTGWYFADFVWRLRGAIDRLMGGIGLRRGRRHPSNLHSGDALDFFRVLEVEPPLHLHLFSEMKLPGEATLEFRIHRLEDGRAELQQLSRYVPRGILGLIYWYSLYPIHQWIFSGMLRGIAKAAGSPVVQGPDRLTKKRPDSCHTDPYSHSNE